MIKKGKKLKLTQYIQIYKNNDPFMMLDPFAQLFQHCWDHARALHLVSKVLWVVSLPRCTTGFNIVGCCCIRLHATDATTPRIVGRLHLALHS